MSVTQQQVISLLENVLFESATLATANAATWEANAAAASVSSLASAMAASGEETIAATVVGYYITALGRAPTAAEVSYYVGIAEQGLTTAQISAGDVSSATWNQISEYFSHSAEFEARSSLSSTIGLDHTGLLLQAVPWLYESVLGRAASTAEISYYDNQVMNGTDISTLFREFTASAEFHTDTDSQIASALASFGTSAATGGNTSLSTVGGSVTTGTPTPTPSSSTPVPPPPAPSPTSFSTLSNGIDTIADANVQVGTAHTYDAVIDVASPSQATLNSGDILHGNGLATLAIVDSDDSVALMPTGLTLDGIASMTVTLNAAFSVGADAGSSLSSTFDVSGVGGLTYLEIDTGASNGDFITATDLVAVHLNAGSSEIGVDGFASVALFDASVATLDLSGTGAGDVTMANPGNATLTVHTDSLELTGDISMAGGSVATLNISETGSGTSHITGTVSGPVLATVTVTGDIQLGTDDSHAFVLGSTVTSANLSGDTHIADTNYISVGGNNLNLTLGTNTNSVDLGTYTGTIINVGTDLNGFTASAPNLIVNMASTSFILAFSSGSLGGGSLNDETGFATSITDLVALISSDGPRSVEWAQIGGNTYIVESLTPTPDPTSTTIVEIIGNHTVTASGSGLSIV